MGKTLFVGHSLVGQVIPSMFNDFMASQSLDIRADAQVINGAPLRYNWDNGASAEGVNAREVLASGDYDTVIVTEAIPLDAQIQWNDTQGYAKRYFDLAQSSNGETRFYLYETWHEIGADTQEWRAQIANDLSKWQGIVDYVNDNAAAGAREALVIPAGQAMAQLHDRIEAGEVPGITSIRDLFSDDIHLNDTGSWFIAALHASVVTGLDASTLPLETFNAWGGSYGGPDAVLAQIMADVIDATLDEFLPQVSNPPAGESEGLVLIGDADDNTLDGGDWNDELFGDAGNDQLSGGAGDDTVGGGNGGDTLYGGNDDDIAMGGSGDDSVYGNSGNDSLLGDDGDDTIFGGSGFDTLRGGDGKNELYAGSGNDKVYGGAGSETVSGASGDDLVVGGSGNDLVEGGQDEDTLYGNAGNDTLNGEDGNDWSSGGDGVDLLLGRDGNDTMRGGNGDDRFFGGADDDVLAGNVGDDTIEGGSGNDRIFAGNGNDEIVGGAGRDVLNGGADADVFVFENISDSAHGANRDTITDFTAGTDMIDLSEIMSGLTFVSSYSGTAGEVRYNGSVGRLYLDVDGDSASELSIDLTGAPSLTAADMIF